MAKVRENKKEVEGKSVVTPQQADARTCWDATKSLEACRWRVEERDELRHNRSPREQLEHLDARLGQYEGAEKERVRLLLALDHNERMDYFAGLPFGDSRRARLLRLVQERESSSRH